jgi:hypothetical protein
MMNSRGAKDIGPWSQNIFGFPENISSFISRKNLPENILNHFQPREIALFGKNYKPILI